MTAQDFANQWINKFQDQMVPGQVEMTAQIPSQDAAFGMSTPSDLPEGFTLDAPQSDLPEGFVLDAEPMPVAKSEPITPSQQFAAEHPFARTLGRAGRATLTGLSSLVDTALLLPKTAALGAGLGLESLGAEKVGTALQRVGMIPSQSQATKDIIDEATGGRLKPNNWMDKAGDFAGELISSAMPFYSAPNVVQSLAPKAPTGGTALRAALDPETALQQTMNSSKSVAKITADDIRKQSGMAYQKARDLGGSIKPEVVDSFVDDIEKSVLPQTRAGKIVAGKDSPVTALMGRINELKGSHLDLDEAQEIDELLGDAIDGMLEMGKPTKEGLKVIKIQDALRSAIEGADETKIVGGKRGFDALKEGRALWAKAAKLRDVEKIITRGEMSEQPANAIKSGFKTLYNNPSRMRGFSTEERAAIKKAAGVTAQVATTVNPPSFAIVSQLILVSLFSLCN